MVASQGIAHIILHISNAANTTICSIMRPFEICLNQIFVSERSFKYILTLRKLVGCMNKECLETAGIENQIFFNDN